MNQYLVTRPDDPDEVAKVKDVILWTQLADAGSIPLHEVERIRKEHTEKLNRYRARKDWEAWVEEDELDIEGERIISEIKNFKAEYFYKVSANFRA